MLTFFHSPNSRSTAILSLIEEMGVQDRVESRLVSIPRVDGTGKVDPANPHPEGKVPCLVHEGQVITERGAIMIHLTTLFPGKLAPKVGTPEWGKFVSWMNWYQGVMEPVLICKAAGIEHPYLFAGLRGHDEVVARLRAGLETGPWIMGEAFTAADILLHSPYAWFRDFTPNEPLIEDWVACCMARPARERALEKEMDMTAKLAA
jgi:glutathione S-transferase